MSAKPEVGIFLIPYVFDREKNYITPCPFGMSAPVTIENGDTVEAGKRVYCVGSPECAACAHSIPSKWLEGRQIYCIYPRTLASSQSVKVDYSQQGKGRKEDSKKRRNQETKIPRFQETKKPRK